MLRHRFDVETMLRIFELNVKNPAFSQQTNSSNARTNKKPMSQLTFTTEFMKCLE